MVQQQSAPVFLPVRARQCADVSVANFVELLVSAIGERRRGSKTPTTMQALRFVFSNTAFYTELHALCSWMQDNGGGCSYTRRLSSCECVGTPAHPNKHLM